jgi:hypothetical protein
LAERYLLWLVLLALVRLVQGLLVRALLERRVPSGV